MNFVKLLLDVSYGNYSYKDASNVEMSILGHFFCDVGPNKDDIWKWWALNSPDWSVCGSNSTVLEKIESNIVLSDECPVEPIPTKLTMTIEQFMQLFDEWQEKVVKLRPKEVIIKHEHGKFFIEIAD